MIADELSMNSERVWKIIMKDLCENVPRLLNDGQKKHCVQVCQDILKQLKIEPDLLSRIVTSDKSWIFEYNPLTKWQSLEWKSTLSPRLKKARLFKSKIKVMLMFSLMFMDLFT